MSKPATNIYAAILAAETEMRRRAKACESEAKAKVHQMTQACTADVADETIRVAGLLGSARAYSAAADLLVAGVEPVVIDATELPS